MRCRLIKKYIGDKKPIHVSLAWDDMKPILVTWGVTNVGLKSLHGDVNWRLVTPKFLKRQFKDRSYYYTGESSGKHLLKRFSV